MANWPNSNADATIGEFDRTALQNAINTIYSAYGGWDAKIVVSQVNWDHQSASDRTGAGGRLGGPGPRHGRLANQ